MKVLPRVVPARRWVILLLALHGAVLKAQYLSAPEFQINEVTLGDQYYPSVAHDSKGNFVVVWVDRTIPNHNIIGRRFDRSGTPLAQEFQINTDTQFRHTRSHVSQDPKGNFVVIWNSRDQDGSGLGIFGRRFNSAGAPQSAEFQMNSYTSGYQGHAGISHDPNGNFVVAWASRAQKGGSYYNLGIFAQRFDSFGQRVGPEFQVNSFTFFDQYGPELVHDAFGGFVVVWSSQGQDPYFLDRAVVGRRFEPNGIPIGGEFQVSSATWHYERRPHIAMGPEGDFVVTWVTPGQGFAVRNILARRFDSSATPMGLDFKVDTSTSFNAWVPKVSFASTGAFVVAWTAYIPGSRFEVLARRLDRFGTPLGADFVVNSITTFEQTYPVLIHDTSGNFLILWESTHIDGWDILGRRFILNAVAAGPASGGQSRLRIHQRE